MNFLGDVQLSVGLLFILIFSRNVVQNEFGFITILVMFYCDRQSIKSMTRSIPLFQAGVFGNGIWTFCSTLVILFVLIRILALFMACLNKIRTIIHRQFTDMIRLWSHIWIIILSMHKCAGLTSAYFWINQAYYTTYNQFLSNLMKFQFHWDESNSETVYLEIIYVVC